MNFWIIKSDPESYSWDDMKKDKKTFWDGVRNYQARNNLKLMKKSDICLFYLSNKDKALSGEVTVVKEYYQDPTTDDERWVCVDVKYKKEYKNYVTLAEMKNTPELQNISLIKQSRLSVMPITEDEYNKILEMSQ